MTCADPFTRADPLFRAAAETAARPHPALHVYAPRPITLADIAKVTARAIITGICLAVAIAPAIILTAMEHTR